MKLHHSQVLDEADVVGYLENHPPVRPLYDYAVLGDGTTVNLHDAEEVRKFWDEVEDLFK